MLAGYAGREWEAFCRVLVDYAGPRLVRWTKSGKVAIACARRGRGFVLAQAARQDANAEELAEDTVAEAIVGFRDEVLVPGLWDRTRGATLKTFFFGRCILVFPNIYRAWRRRHQRHHAASRTDDAALQHLPENRWWSHPEQITIQRSASERAAEIGDAMCELLVLDSAGFSNGEIASKIGITEKAVEGRLARHFGKRK